MVHINAVRFGGFTERSATGARQSTQGAESSQGLQKAAPLKLAMASATADIGVRLVHGASFSLATMGLNPQLGRMSVERNPEFIFMASPMRVDAGRAL